MDVHLGFQIATFLFLFISTTRAIDPIKVFNVKDFGAIADGQIDSRKALLTAWKEACAWNGGGRVLIPEGTFLLGPVLLNGPCNGKMILQVKGVVKAATDLNIFTTDAWIDFQNINGLMITGGGTFDGQGSFAWPHNNCPKNFNCKVLPHSIRLYSIVDAMVRRISLVDSKFFHVNIFRSKDIKFISVKISAPDESPNTDGIHIGDSSGVRISRSVIGTGDDCISLGPGSSNITVSNVFCGPGHGISVGSLGRYPNEANVEEVTVRNCTFTGTTNGVRIKTWEGSPVSSASNFKFEDIVMNNVYNPIIIDQEYCPYTSCSQEDPSRVKINGVRFRNIRGTSASQVAVKILCSKGMPCQNVELMDINLVYNGQGVAIASCANVNGLSSGIVVPPPCF